MKTTSQISRNILQAVLILAVAANTQAASTDISTTPLIVSSTGTTSLTVQPNVFLMMDDSGSMAWDFMPDIGNSAVFGTGKYGYASNQCNGVFYDPSYTYAPPVTSTGSNYPNSTFTAAPIDGYGTTTASTLNLATNFLLGQQTNTSPTTSGGGRAYYYIYSGTQTSGAQKNYSNTSSTFYLECNSNIGSTPGSSVFKKQTLDTVETTTITISGTNSTSVSSIKVNNVELMSGTSTASTNSATVATNIAAKITLNGFSATASGSTVTITGPTSAANYTPVITQSGSMTLVTDVFPETSAAKLLNFANWYSYYRTRILMMKTATGLAFKPICPATTPATACGYRVGMGTMNNNGSNKFLNVETFDATQKSNFYTMLYSTSANSSTPLLGALSKAGQMYAYKLPGNTLNGVTAKDPIQYSCQQNFTILSTDGFWNDATNAKVNGGSVGQQDGTEIRPMYDGANQTSQTVTVAVTDTYKQTSNSYSTTTPWTRTVTTLGASCPLPGATLPTTCLQGNSSAGTRTWCMEANTSKGSECQGAFSSGTQVYTCRGKSNATNLPGGTDTACVKDSSGTSWCLFANNTSAGTSSCQSNGYDLYVCAVSTTVAGKYVTIQNQVYNQVVTGTNVAVNNNQTTTTTTVQTINGQVQPATTSNAGPTIIPVSTNATISTDSGVPTGTTSWANSGGAATPVCTANPPAASTTIPVAGTSSTTNGAQTVTVLTGYPTTSTPATYNGNPNPNVITNSTGGTSNTLADVAEYYYMTDLRTSAFNNNLSSAPGTVNGTDVSTNNVPSSNLDAASWQHMTTFTLGLGARGKMVYSPSYQTDTSGDYFSVKNGAQANPSGGVCSWQASGSTCNWPIPNVSGTPENIDDLWHAAVNGRGTYFAATNPGTLAQGISTALSGVSARTGSSAAATTSNPNVTSGDNFVFSSTFVSKQWIGELVRQQLDLTTGNTLPAIDWAAQAQLDTNSSRNIYTYSAAASNKLQGFTAAAFGSNSNFSGAHISLLSQFCTSGSICLPVWQANHIYAANDEFRVISGATTVWYKVNATYTSGSAFGATDTANTTVITGAAGANLVNFIRGDRTNEGIQTDTTKYFRQRLNLLGDIVNAEAVYLKVPLQGYSDYGYSAYKTSSASRQGMVYAAANDGMLHAFYSETNKMDSNGNIVAIGGTNVTGGGEAWAYIPSIVLPNLYLLADKNYDNNHQYYVDGTPVAEDICVASDCKLSTTAATDWRTIIVGGLNAGGNGYYAMDVTNPASPKLLWEFTDVNMGLTFGNPQIAKLKDGTWVVILTSGYNNNAVGDGMGHLYVLNAHTGTLMHDINTGVGNSATPSGLGRIVAHVVNPGADSTIINIYAGDMLGNVWRFNVDPWLPNHKYVAGDGYWNGTTWYHVNSTYTSGIAFGSTDQANSTSGSSVNSSFYGVQLLATLQGSANNVQPITTKPQVGLVSGKTMVYVGTGRYLGNSDLSDKSPQSIYGIVDPLTPGTTPSTAIYNNPRAVTRTAWAASHTYAVGDQFYSTASGSGLVYTVTKTYTSGATFGASDVANTTSVTAGTSAAFVSQTLTTTTCPAGSPTTICAAGQIVRTITHNSVNAAIDKGWYVDLLDTTATPQNVGERANNDPTLKLGTLGFTTNIPSASSCTVGGSSFTYFFDYRNGSAVSSSTTSVAGTKLGNALATRPVYVRLPNNTVVQLIRLSDGTTLTTNVPIGSGASGTRRVSWRELTQ